MKTLRTCILLMMCLTSFCPMCAETPGTVKQNTNYVKGDVNGDSIVDVSDIARLVSLILGTHSSSPTEEASDVNGDGCTDISDIAALVNLILSEPEEEQGTEDMEEVPGEWE